MTSRRSSFLASLEIRDRARQQKTQHTLHNKSATNYGQNGTRRKATKPKFWFETKYANNIQSSIQNHYVHVHLTPVQRHGTKNWMIKDVNYCGSVRRMKYKASKEFLDLFRWTECGNVMRPKPLWENSETTMSTVLVCGDWCSSGRSAMTLSTIGKKRVRTKALSRRSRKSLL